MSTSASRRPAARAAAGFTLLEIMATVAMLGVCILPLLEARERASHLTYRSAHMMRAMTYGQRILTDRMLNPDRAKELTAPVEEDPAYQYVLTIEVFDLSTGRIVEEEDPTGFSDTSSFNAVSNFTSGKPGDAGPGEEEEDDVRHQVRRFKLVISWPSIDDDAPSQLVLEGFLPRVEEEEDVESSLDAASTGNDSGGAGNTKED